MFDPFAVGIPVNGGPIVGGKPGRGVNPFATGVPVNGGPPVGGKSGKGIKPFSGPGSGPTPIPNPISTPTPTPGSTPPIFEVDIASIAGGSSTPGADPSFQWLLGWLVMIILLVLINRTRLGHVIIYYSLWLILIFLLLSQAPGIAKVLASVGTPAP